MTDHQRIWGSGFHAGKEASAGNKARGRERGVANATTHMLCWNPGTAEVELVPWPDQDQRSDRFSRSGLACYSHIQKMNFDQRKMMVFIEAMHLIVRDSCDPVAVHRALLLLDEYRDGCADDMLSVDPRWTHLVAGGAAQ